jgi:uncharacterized BrkB/YihY/UPF0761 family membrane protein
MWVAVLALLLLYFAIVTPLRMIRHGGQQNGGYHPGWGVLHGLMWLGFTMLVFWLAYTLLPGVREVVDQLMWAAHLTVTTISETIV